MSKESNPKWQETVASRKALCEFHMEHTDTIVRTVRSRSRGAKKPGGIVCAFEARNYKIPENLNPGRTSYLDYPRKTLLIGFSRCCSKDPFERWVGLWTAIRNAVPASSIPSLIINGRTLSDLRTPPSNQGKFAIRTNKTGSPINVTERFPYGTPVLPPSLNDAVLAIMARAAEHFNVPGIIVGRLPGPRPAIVEPMNGITRKMSEWMNIFFEETSKEPPKDAPKSVIREYKRTQRTRIRHLCLSLEGSVEGWLPFSIYTPSQERVKRILEMKKAS